MKEQGMIEEWAKASATELIHKQYWAHMKTPLIISALCRRIIELERRLDEHERDDWAHGQSGVIGG